MSERTAAACPRRQGGIPYYAKIATAEGKQLRHASFDEWACKLCDYIPPDIGRPCDPIQNLPHMRL